jgi:hypothetical protein
MVVWTILGKVHLLHIVGKVWGSHSYKDMTAAPFEGKDRGWSPISTVMPHQLMVKIALPNFWEITDDLSFI